MPNTNKQHGEQQGANDPAGSGPAPDETQEGAQPGDDQMGACDGEQPEELEEPLEPYQIILQGFWTISQTLSAAYGAATSEIQTIVWKSLAKATAEDQTFVWGASGAIRHWLDSIKPAMAATEKSTKDQVELLAEACQAGKDALDSILKFIPEEEEQEMDNMATNQVLLPNQIVPNLWGSRRGLLEGISLLSPLSCLASWPASLVERVTAVPACQAISSSSKTPTKPNNSPSGAVKTTPDSGKKHTTKQAAGLFWSDNARPKEDAEARQLEEKCRKKSTGPVLSLGDHEESIASLLKQAPASRISQPSSQASSSSSKCWEKSRGRLPPTNPSDDEPLSDKADEPKAKNCKCELTLDLVVLEDDDNTPLPRKTKSVGKKGHTWTPDEEEAVEALCQHLKGEARSI